MTDISAKEFGALQQKVETLSENVEHLSGSVEKLTEALSEAKGGWKILAAIGGLVVTFSGGVSWLVAHFKFTP